MPLSVGHVLQLRATCMELRNMPRNYITSTPNCMPPFQLGARNCVHLQFSLFEPVGLAPPEKSGKCKIPFSITSSSMVDVTQLRRDKSSKNQKFVSEGVPQLRVDSK